MVQTESASKSTPVTLGIYLLRLRRMKWRVMVLILLCTATAAGVALLLPPIYRAEVLLAPAADQTGSGGGLAQLAASYSDIASIAGVSLPNEMTSQYEAIATLTSRALLERFIEDAVLLPVLFPDKWNVESKQWDVSPEDAPTLWHGYRQFQTRIMTVNQDRRTNLVTLTIDWRDPEVAADWANELVARTNDALRQRDIEEGRKSIEYLDQELARTDTVALRTSLYRLIETQLGRVTLATVNREFAFRVIDPAKAPGEKFAPQRVQIVVMGFIAGLLCAGVMLVVATANGRQEFHQR